MNINVYHPLTKDPYFGFVVIFVKMKKKFKKKMKIKRKIKTQINSVF